MFVSYEDRMYWNSTEALWIVILVTFIFLMRKFILRLDVYLYTDKYKFTQINNEILGIFMTNSAIFFTDIVSFFQIWMRSISMSIPILNFHYQITDFHDFYTMPSLVKYHFIHVWLHITLFYAKQVEYINILDIHKKSMCFEWQFFLVPVIVFCIQNQCWH